MAKRRVFDATQTLDDATAAAETGIATVTALRREIGVPVREIPLVEIVDNPDNPRSSYDTAELEELAASISEIGVLQPIVVRALTPAERAEHPAARFLTVAGHRRRRAAAQAQLTTIPTVERAGNGGAAGDLVLMLTENMQRQDLKPLDEARSFKILSDSGLTQMQISKALGISQAKISKRIALLDLEPSVQATIAAGTIAAEAAQAFRGTDHEVQRRAAQMLQKLVTSEDHDTAAESPNDSAEPAADQASSAPTAVTVTDVRESVARAQRQLEAEARELAQEEVARAAGARILPEHSKYVDWRRQIHNANPEQLAKLAAAGHLGAQCSSWGSTPNYFNTDPELLTKQAAADTRRKDNDRAKTEHRQQLRDQADQAMVGWAQQFTVSAADATAQLASALIEDNTSHLGQVYEWLHPGETDVEDETIERWLQETKASDRPRLALLAVAARDADSTWNDEMRERTRLRLAEVDPRLAAQLAESEKK